MSEGKGLQDLVQDVLFLIFANCDIGSIVAIGGTSKYFHQLAFARNVWFPLVKNLVQRRFIDRGPDDGELNDLSTKQLVDKVKRIVRGPRTWSAHEPSQPSVVQTALRRSADWAKGVVHKSPASSKPTVPPVESRRIILHPHIATGSGILFWENEPKLLPGGRYVLFQNWGKLECWNVFEDRLIWKHKCTMDGASVLAFAAELTDDDQAVILTCQRTWNNPRQNFIEVTTLDLQAGVSSLILVSRVPNSRTDGPYTGCTICGDIAVVELDELNQVLLINWRTSSCVVILTGNSQSGSRCSSRIALAADYLVLTRLSSRGELQLACGPLPPPVSWAPVDVVHEPSSSVSIGTLPTILADTITLNGRTFTLAARSLLSVHENPLEPGGFRVWFYLSGGGNVNGVLCSYELAVRPSGVSWHWRSSVPVNGNLVSFGLAVSYSGHSVGWRGQAMIFPPVPLIDEDSEPRRTLKLDKHGDFIHLSLYSGALTYATNKVLIIVYYD
ncbi:hypothetical protein FB451DRAFT_1267702 [Mycena latifolia]|nr:hypothetical protein FB451DRAFT_1267702 [Mycena latifolia]